MTRKKTGAPRGRPAYKPSEEDRAVVNSMAANGIAQERIARAIGGPGGIAVGTLVKYYREELETASIKAEAVIAGTAYNKAKAGDVHMIRYWLNCRAHWTEKSEIQHSGSIGINIIKAESDL